MGWLDKADFKLGAAFGDLPQYKQRSDSCDVARKWRETGDAGYCDIHNRNVVGGQRLSLVFDLSGMGCCHMGYKLFDT